MQFNPEVGIRQWLVPGGGGWRADAGATKADSVGFHWNTFEKSDGAVLSEIQVDLRRPIAWASEARSVTSLAGDEFLLVGRTPSKALLEAWIAPARAARYTRAKFSNKEGQPFLEIDTLVVNESLQGRALRFPVDLEKQLGLQPPITLGLGGMGEFLQTWASALALNKGLYDPSRRKDIEKDLGRSVDWVELERRNATIGSSLRKAMEERD